MTAVPLGKGAYRRLYAGAPEVKLLNRWLEENPTNLREGTSVLGRPGSTNLLTLEPGTFAGLGPMRGNYALSGLFDDSLFVVCGQNLYRVNQDMSVTNIVGTIGGTGYPEVGWQAGIGYQQFWISDGTTLQYYTGTTHATGVLDKIGTIVNGTDVFEVGGVYYTWGTTFSSTDAGTSAHPYVVNPNTSDGDVLDPMSQLVLAVMNSGTGGVDYSSTIIGPNTQVSAATGMNGVVSVEVINGGTGWGTTVPTVVFSGGGGTGAQATAVLTGGVITAINVTNAGYNYAQPPEVSFTGGSGTGAIAQAVTGTPSPAAAVVFSALAEGTAGNSITFTVTGGAALSASGSGTLANGGIDALEGCTVPEINGSSTPSTISQVSSYLLVGVANTNQFYWINPGDTTINPLNFASKESSPDPIICIREVGDQVLIMGAKSTENWYATGNFASPFAPIEGRVYARGVYTGTPVVIDDAVILVGDDGRVYSIGFQSGDGTDAGWGVQRISNNGIEERVRRQIRREAGLNP